MSDLDVIKKIGRQIGEKLEEYDIDLIWFYNGYVVNQQKQVVALNLEFNQLKNISFLTTLNNLTELYLQNNKITNPHKTKMNQRTIVYLKNHYSGLVWLY